MPVKTRKAVPARSRPELFAPRIYYLHPLLAGPAAKWPDHLRRCRDLGFDHLLTAPLFAPGAQGDIFLAGRHNAVHPALGVSAGLDDFVGTLAENCREEGLALLVDVEIGRVAADADIVATAPGWFRGDEAAALDPRSVIETHVAHARFDEPTIAKELAAWWIERLRGLAAKGVAGFGCRNPHLVPAGIWRHLIASVRDAAPACRLLAWTPGLSWDAIRELRGVGFAAAFSSQPWWDGRAGWFVEEYEVLRGVGSVISYPEAPFGPRLARRLGPGDATACRHLLHRAAATGTGLLISMGFEFGATADMDRRRLSFDDLAPCGDTTDIEADIREANALAAQLADIGVGGEMRPLANPDHPVTCLLRSDAADSRHASASVLVLINSDLRGPQRVPIPLDPLPAAAGAALAADKKIVAGDCGATLAPGEIRILGTRRAKRVKLRLGENVLGKLAALPRIVIENVAPAVDAGRFPAKCVIGDGVTVEADVLTDGHELLAVDVIWRAADENAWRRTPMRPAGNDRWEAPIAPERIGRHEFTIEAWRDRYGTFCHDLEIKRGAGVAIALELAEGRALLEGAKQHNRDAEGRIIGSALNWLDAASPDESADILLAPDLREVMRYADDQPFRTRREPHFVLDVERPQAAFGAWYELFPRSAGATPGRHGTFDDVIGRLPAIRDMGFDVLYLTPIHPIGMTNRKGRNNALRAGPDDVGSPYAIGSSEGGHDAINPSLGTIEDFRRLRDAAAAQGLELALDFAIQCSPDHPWLVAHPEWFNWRPDGSVRYAENPPKKYEDIVNVDFYAKDGARELWMALRDIVLFWAGEGVNIFRVDNPHTKPLPFWEWLIAQVRARHPDAIFLSEAFTRPKMMYRLAKAGFSQSYTYFTWRHAKGELTNYFTELTGSEVKDYFRPHLFVNTPDINPYFLQNSGRPGFLVRAALAATLSGLWGMYSGFELCEAAALPGREEYLDSEKYEIKTRRYDAPGNIVAEITRLNRIRRSNPALQSHLGLRFYTAHNDNVIYYGKSLRPRDDIILIAVSLDPFQAQETAIEVPLWEWNLPDTAEVDVEDLFHDNRFVWRGKLQRVRLDPHHLPFAIWRVTPRSAA